MNVIFVAAPDHKDRLQVHLASLLTACEQHCGPQSSNISLAVAEDAADSATKLNNTNRLNVVVRVEDAAPDAPVILFSEDRFQYDYDTRIIVNTANLDLPQAAQALMWHLRHRNMRFVSTRGATAYPDGSSFGILETIRDGLSHEGGLFLPKDLPHFSPAALAWLVDTTADGKHLYHRTAQFTMEELIGCHVVGNQQGQKLHLPSPALISTFITKAYEDRRWNNLETCISPLTPIFNGSYVAQEEGGGGGIDNICRHHASVFLMEQYHGPTAAFKDFALQLFPCLFGAAVKDETSRYIILAATSGDTGVAAINGMLHSAPPTTKIMVLFPEYGVSPVQKAQMLAMSDGKRVQVVGVKSTFDLCQSTVKQMFKDDELARRLAQSATPSVLSSANSINWGRLMPQIVYYVHAYAQLSQRNLIRAPAVPEFDVLVPTGNFGNILSAFLARKMGIPIRRFILASNENDVLFEFITTGVYDITNKALVPTISPSIDILKASNVERFLYYLFEGDCAAVSDLMSNLENHKRFELPQMIFKQRLQPLFWASKADQSRVKATISAVFTASGGTRLLDPHTAVAAAVLEDYLALLEERNESVFPIVVASTAHWGKFPEPVMDALGLEKPNAEAFISPAHFVQAMHDAIQTHCPKAQPVPSTLLEAVAAPMKETPVVVENTHYDNFVDLLERFARK